MKASTLQTALSLSDFTRRDWALSPRCSEQHQAHWDSVRTLERVGCCCARQHSVCGGRYRRPGLTTLRANTIPTGWWKSSISCSRTRRAHLIAGFSVSLQAPRHFGVPYEKSIYFANPARRRVLKFVISWPLTLAKLTFPIQHRVVFFQPEGFGALWFWSSSSRNGVRNEHCLHHRVSGADWRGSKLNVRSPRINHRFLRTNRF
jgi:hypothetical protein